ncbi:alpha/beta hydrolase [Microbispora corallina]|uniref:Hydrolase n=1 Tax=Microbispora corallina TaxID=83302 RepID=A0ABQ4FV06_9ACTN|nr:alpha/beta hydrolase [Microbispora corallina]GIH38538.1 hydrolase [Microbispora corallina]
MELKEFAAARRTVTTRSGPVAYTEFGEGPAALFVHGAGTNGGLWRHVVEAVRDERRCLAVDLPLHGGTPARPGQDLTLGGLAQVVEDFCDAAGLDRVDLVANDTGGGVAQVLVARRPDLARTLTLTNCDTRDDIPPAAFVPTIELAAAGAISATASALLADLDLVRASGLGAGYEHPDKVADETFRAYLEPVLGTPEAARQFERLLLSLGPADLVAADPALRRLTTPTLVVWGTGDVFFDVRWAHWLRDTIPGVTEVVEVDGARLFFPEERPDDLVPHLRRHWAAHA